MFRDSNAGSAWRFAIRVVAPVLVAVAITMATLAGFIYWSVARSDDRALQRETHLIGKVIGQELKKLREHQVYYSSWDEAITALGSGDVEWIDANLGSDLFGAAAFDRIYVLRPDASPLYAMYAGGKTDADRFEADRAAVSALVERLRAIDAAGALAAFDSGNATEVPSVADFGLVDGKPAFIGVSAIMSESGAAMAQLPGQEHFLVAVRFLAGALNADLTGQYFIEAPTFAAVASSVSDVANHALVNEGGTTIGWFNWRPDRPGARLLAETMPAMAGAMAIAAIVLVLLLRGLRRSTAALEKGKSDAEYQANHDILTGLANRAYFNQQLREVGAASDGDRASVALLALDLDRFKQVNDTLGHQAGDQLLREVGDRLAPLIGDGDTIARLGGDEFAIIQRNISSADDAGALSARIIDKLGIPFIVAGRVTQIGVSIGVVVAQPSETTSDLYAKADIALYEAKAAGRNTFKIFDEALAKAAQFRSQVRAEIRASKLPGGRDLVA